MATSAEPSNVLTKELMKLSKKELIKKGKKLSLNMNGLKTKSELVERIIKYKPQNKEKYKEVANDGNNYLDLLSHAIILKIVEFNCNHQDFINLKTTNKSFYDLLNPNEYIVNKIWEKITRNKYPLVAAKLKCKRWDIYYKHRVMKIRDAEKNNWEHKEIKWSIDDSEVPFANVIEGCDHDINNLNEEYEVKISGNRISKKRGGKYDDVKENEIFKGEIGSNGLPKGFNKKLRCPMIMAGNWQFLSYKGYSDGVTKYNCNECKRDVHVVTTLDEMKQKLSEKKCVRVVYYDDGWIEEEDGDCCDESWDS